MKKLLVAAFLSLLAQAGSAAEPQIGVSIAIQQPGVYGRIDFGNVAPPPVVLRQPVVIVQQAQPQPPMYLYVPVDHRRNWKRHCGRYDACGRPVYFVQEKWVKERYEKHHGRGKHGRGPGKKDD